VRGPTLVPVTPSDHQGAHPLAHLGFDHARVEEALAADLAPGLAARVVRIDRGWATLQGARKVRRVPLRDCPHIVVGDWLVPDGLGTLQRLGRRSLLVRRSVSGRDEPQHMAANVDVVLVTWALDTRVGSARLKDMLALARDSGATPVLVLSKVDAGDADDAAPDLLGDLGDSVAGIEVVTTSTVTGEGLDRLRELTGGRTVVLLGASGAGKSTLTNILLGDDAMATGEVGRTGEGRHTTTRRELLPLPGGGAIIDTPGIRAASAWEDEATGEVPSPFPDLDDLAEECRFSDCTHDGTPGCALGRAVDDGELAPSRLAAYRAFVTELAGRTEARESAARQDRRDRNRRHRP
jgi:ribosome biogenesis GTPase / thiamine phosphate phosphatase